VLVDAPLPHPHPGFLAKVECLSPGGMKARAAVSMLAGARSRGELAPGAPVVESTSGTMGVGLAFAGQALGHPVVLVVDRELEPSMRALLRAHGARLEVVDAPHPVGGWQQARLDRLLRVRAALPGAYWPDQYRNPDNAAGYAGLADEIFAQADVVDTLLCSVGTGGH
ncbi:pyridoxal-phosphate dependent enzyme, partial [Micromonospora sp. DH15]|nr:pyridoxal-phosphate dependent enzyme [Micromonospora sp. DH15]